MIGHRKAAAAGLLALGFLWLPAAARAHDTGSAHLHVFAEAGVRMLDGELFLSMRPGVVLESEPLSFVLAPLIHLGLDGDGRPALRPEDFESPGDLGRVLYLLRAGDRAGRWQVVAGALANERLGHGSVVGGFATSVDPDGPRTALRLDVSGEAMGIEAVAASLLDPVLLAARVHAAPLLLAGSGGRAAGAWRVGLLAAMDPLAPTALTGETRPGGLIGAETAPVAYASLDTSVVMYRDHRLSIMPYTDGVLSVAGPRRGRGAIHLGARADIEAIDDARVVVRAEARRLGSAYVAEPFDALYSIERWGFPLGGTTPKATAEELRGGWGAKATVALEREEGGLLSASVDGRPGGPFGYALRAGLVGWGPFSASALYMHRGLFWSGSEGGWWLALADLRWLLSDSFYLVCRGGRGFRIDREDARYRPAWDLAVLAGATL